MFDVIANGTIHTLEFARQCKAEKMLFTSSGAVYERYNNINNGFNPYVEGKWIAEQFCAWYVNKYGLDIKIARIYSTVGAYMPLDRHFAIGNFIRDLLKGSDILVKGDGKPYRSYLYAADMVIWLWTILFKGGNIPYNVGSEEAITIEGLAKLVSKTAKPPMPVVVSGDKNQGQQRYIPSTKRAYEELGLQQHIGLKEAIKRTVEWQKEKDG